MIGLGGKEVETSTKSSFLCTVPGSGLPPLDCSPHLALDNRDHHSNNTHQSHMSETQLGSHEHSLQ